jgi:hypothetical protein
MPGVRGISSCPDILVERVIDVSGSCFQARVVSRVVGALQ